MDKNSFVNRINCDNKDMISNLYDKLQLAYRSGKTIYSSEFYTPNIWMPVLDMAKHNGVDAYCFGVFEDAERKLLIFSNEQTFNYPVKIIKIMNKSKFHKLEHKDFLGAIMSLGIRREKFGDLILYNDSCYLPAFEEIYEYIRTNLESIGRCPCCVEAIDKIDDNILKSRFEDLNVITTSYRIDCIVSSICNMSRAKSVALIEQGKVLVDYVSVSEKDKVLENGSIITIRGYGKFRIVSETGSTQKGRIKLQIKKYI